MRGPLYSGKEFGGCDAAVVGLGNEGDGMPHVAAPSRRARAACGALPACLDAGAASHCLGTALG